MITGTAIGKISRAGKIIRPDGGKSPFLTCTICSTRHYGGKSYDTYCEVLVYGKQIDQLVNQVVMNAIACASGEMSVSVNDKGEKTYYNLKLVGQLEILSAGKAETPVERTPPVAPSAEKAPGPVDDDVPF